MVEGLRAYEVGSCGASKGLGAPSYPGAEELQEMSLKLIRETSR